MAQTPQHLEKCAKKVAERAKEAFESDFPDVREKEMTEKTELREEYKRVMLVPVLSGNWEDREFEFQKLFCQMACEGCKFNDENGGTPEDREHGRFCKISRFLHKFYVEKPFDPEEA